MILRQRCYRKPPAWTARAWAVLAATLIHNAEELVTVPLALSRPPLADLLGRWDLSARRVERAFRALNWAVSGAAAVATVVGTRRDRPALPGVLAATMLLNVVIPHLPAAVRARGYAPGVVTAVGVVLPVTGGYLARARQDGVLTPRQLRRCGQGALALLVLGLPLGLLLSDRLAQIWEHRHDHDA